jgi:hypothetical protein
VAIGDNRDIVRALHEAKRELIRQLEHQKSAREPMHNRKLGHDPPPGHLGTRASHPACTVSRTAHLFPHAADREFGVLN